MSETTHTPGPWLVTGGNATPCVNDLTGRDVAWPSRRRGYPAMANARLIAAAPELLDALRDVVSYYVVRIGGKVDTRRAAALDRARAAIAKAEGGEG